VQEAPAAQAVLPPYPMPPHCPQTGTWALATAANARIADALLKTMLNSQVRTVLAEELTTLNTWHPFRKYNVALLYLTMSFVDIEPCLRSAPLNRTTPTWSTSYWRNIMRT
jgi:hypothetical protein